MSNGTGSRFEAFRRAERRRNSHHMANFLSHNRDKDLATQERYGDHAALVRRTSEDLQQLRQQVSEQWWRLDALERHL